MKKKDLNVFRFGRGGRGPIDALRKRIRSWAHKRRDWTPSPLLFLAYVRRHALYLGEDEGWALEPEPLIGAHKPAATVFDNKLRRGGARRHASGSGRI